MEVASDERQHNYGTMPHIVKFHSSFLFYIMKMSHYKHVIYLLMTDALIIVSPFMYRARVPALKSPKQIKCMLTALRFLIPAKLNFAFVSIFRNQKKLILFIYVKCGVS